MKIPAILAASLTALTAIFSVCSCRGPERVEPQLLFCQKDVETQRSQESVQGTAICGDLMFSMRNTGLCVVTDLKAASLVSEFRLASSGAQNHANDAFFGPGRYCDEDRFPLLYVSQCKSRPVTEIGLPQTDTLSRLCFVERVLVDSIGRPAGTQLVQLISYQPRGYHSRLWVFDRDEPQWVWCYGNTVGNEKAGNRISFRKFAFPQYDPQHFLVSLTDDDVVEEFCFDQVLPEGVRGPQDNILQGAAISHGMLFLPVGLGTPEHPSELFYADLRHRGRDGIPCRYGVWDYTDVIPCEMEDADVWDGRLVCTTNSHDLSRPVFAFDLGAFKTYRK